ncbi:MAG: hypothetical protein HW403_1005 [Dehalococcoidia bacterium]|nr:hypothetical protein [Dehalococcoidia bacterium]
MAQVYQHEMARNLTCYKRIKAELLNKNPGQFVAIADGKVVKVAETFDEADEAVRGYRFKLVFSIGDEPLIGPIHHGHVQRSQ